MHIISFIRLQRGRNIESLGSGMGYIMQKYGRENFVFLDNFIRMTVPYITKDREGQPVATVQVADPTVQVKAQVEAQAGATPTSTLQVQDKLNTDNPNVIRLVQVVGEKELSVKEIMDRLGLKDRKNILNLYLTPSMKEGYIRQLYPQSPRHPRQKYLLTVKGLALYSELNLLPNNLKK